jgi:hypothetical protein
LLKESFALLALHAYAAPSSFSAFGLPRENQKCEDELHLQNPFDLIYIEGMQSNIYKRNGRGF